MPLPASRTRMRGSNAIDAAGVTASMPPPTMRSGGETRMTRRLWVCLLVIATITVASTAPSQLTGVPSCLHDDRERPSRR